MYAETVIPMTIEEVADVLRELDGRGPVLVTVDERGCDSYCGDNRVNTYTVANCYAADGQYPGDRMSGWVLKDHEGSVLGFIGERGTILKIERAG